MSINAKERLQAPRSVDAGIETLLELKRRMKGPGEEEAGSKAQDIRAKAKVLGLSVLEGGLGNGWKN